MPSRALGQVEESYSDFSKVFFHHLALPGAIHVSPPLSYYYHGIAVDPPGWVLLSHRFGLSHERRELCMESTTWTGTSAYLMIIIEPFFESEPFPLAIVTLSCAKCWMFVFSPR